MKVTLLELTLAMACREQKKLFRETFGYSAEINQENLEKAYNAGLDIRFYYIYLSLFYNRARRRAVRALMLEYEDKLVEERLARYEKFLEERARSQEGAAN